MVPKCGPLTHLMDVLDSRGRIAGDSADSKKPAPSPGFFATLRNFLARIASPKPTQKPASSNRVAARSDLSDFVLAPGVYRVRIPSKNTETSVDSAIPAIKDSLASVPALPHVVLSLIREVQKPSSTAATVAELASTDPALSSALLRTVNSAACGLMRKVTSVSDAVSYLGFATVRSIVLKSRLDESLPRPGAGATASTASDMRDLWIHCLAVSYIADALCQRIGGVDRGFASTLGLLHDIGKLAVVTALGSYAIPAESDTESLNSREIRAWGIDHASLGATLAHRWSLPADIVQAIRWHHRPERAFEPTDPPALRKAAYVVQIANELAKYAYPYADEIEMDPGAQSACSVLGIDAPLASLMDAPIRAAVTRAILFGFEDVKDAMPRRFICLRRQEVAASGADGHSLGRIRVDQDMLVAYYQSANPAERISAPATPQGVAKLISTAEKYQESSNIPPTTRPILSLTLRALLSNFAVPGIKPSIIEIAYRAQNGKPAIAVRSEALSFSNRLKNQTDNGPRLLETELTSLLHLNWFESIVTTPTGNAILFIAR
jgi:putative nucleotidyltransferase with HDIG domain